MSTQQQTTNIRAAKGGLAAVVGIAVAAALFQFTPEVESGRKVDVTIDASGAVAIRHLSGPMYLRVYLDMIGVPTACDGLTRDENGKPMRPGKSFTEAQCATMLENALVAHARVVMACTPGLALSQDLRMETMREGPRFAAVSGAYNYGTGLYCRSTARDRFNTFNYPGGCTALTWYNKAGGRVVRGLVARRKKEYNVCVNGLGALRR